MIIFLLPAYNEEKDIAILLNRINDAMQRLEIITFKVLVVNDGSTDQTLLVVKACQACMPIEILDHGYNRGLGQAMLTGLTRAALVVEEDDIIITMDADNTHDPRLVGPMVEKIRAGADVVIASRYEEGGEEIGLALHRHVLSYGASMLLRLFFPINGVKDYTCGFRAYRGAALKSVYQTYEKKLVEEHGFTCMAEILIKMRLVRAYFAEVPLVLRYDLKSGPSKMKITRTILRYFVLIARNFARRPSMMAIH